MSEAAVDFRERLLSLSRLREAAHDEWKQKEASARTAKRLYETYIKEIDKLLQAETRELPLFDGDHQ